MSRSAGDLTAMKTELMADPLGLGLTVDPADDAANADKINEVRETIQVIRETIPSVEIFPQIDRDEYVSLALADRQWLDSVTKGEAINPGTQSEIRTGLLQIFPNGTNSRANLLTLLTEDGARWQKMVEDGLLEQIGNWTPSEIALARQS